MGRGTGPAHATRTPESSDCTSITLNNAGRYYSPAAMMRSMTVAATDSEPGMACAYVESVMAGDSWPSSLCTVGTATPCSPNAHIRYSRARHSTAQVSQDGRRLGGSPHSGQGSPGWRRSHCISHSLNFLLHACSPSYAVSSPDTPGGSTSGSRT